MWIYAHEDNSSSGGGAAAGTVVWSPTADAVLDSQAEKKQQPTEIVLNRFTHATPAGGARDIAALGRIVETMAANETCLAIAASEYCYGEEIVSGLDCMRLDWIRCIKLDSMYAVELD